MGFNWVSEVWKDKPAPMEKSPVIGSQEDPISSPVGSFQSLYSSQSGEKRDERDSNDTLCSCL